MAIDDSNILERSFWAHVDRRGPGECWEWTYMRDRRGYGKCRVGHSTGFAHRIAYELARGPLPVAVDGKRTGHFVMHLCNNPPCCNPEHLQLGDALQNHRMMLEAGRGRCQGGVATPIKIDGAEFASVADACRATGMTRGAMRGLLKRALARVSA